MSPTRQGRILRTWGKGLYKIPHSIRVDPAGNVWTTDAASSMVYKFSREGKKLVEISVGGLPVAPRSEFCGTTDIAFASGGRIFISDGYANARILEYTPDALQGAIEQALEAFEKPGAWIARMRRGMAKDFSWDTSAAAYGSFSCFSRQLDCEK